MFEMFSRYSRNDDSEHWRIDSVKLVETIYSHQRPYLFDLRKTVEHILNGMARN